MKPNHKAIAGGGAAALMAAALLGGGAATAQSDADAINADVAQASLSKLQPSDDSVLANSLRALAEDAAEDSIDKKFLQ